MSESAAASDDPVEAPLSREVKVFHRGQERETRRADASFQAVVGSAGGLDVDQQAQTLFEGQFGVLGVAELLFQSGPEAG